MNKWNLSTALLICAIIFFAVSNFAQSTKNQIASESTINAVVGGNIVIILESNKTTGYLWRLDSDLNNEKIEFINSKYFTPKTKLFASPGKEAWTFKALKPGKLTLVFEYRRPWEKKLKPIRIETFIVIIREK